METQNTVAKAWQRKSTQVTLKLMLIGFLILFLLIPKYLILNLVDERQGYNNAVINEVSQSWAGKQLITGPSLVIPYTEKIPDESGKLVTQVEKSVVIFPNDFTINGDVETSVKKRSIYQVLLYNSSMRLTGNFSIPEGAMPADSKITYHPEKAYVVIGISALKGIDNKIKLKWNEQDLPVLPGTKDISFQAKQNSNNSSSLLLEPSVSNFSSGIHAPVDLSNDKSDYAFSFDLNLKGSQQLLFVPIGKNNEIHLTSPFPNPKFVGEFLPEHTTNETGFDAKWSIFEYNRNIPDFQIGFSTIDLSNAIFGVDLTFAIDNYTKAYRSVNYMILVIALTFLVVFLSELMYRNRIHIFQYTLVGLALAIFFVLLLSISEFLSFNQGYLIAAAMTILLLYWYSFSMFSNRKSSNFMLAFLVIEFLYIFVIVQLEKMSLLVGAIGLFISIAGTMYATRKIKWYEDQV